MLKFLSIIFQQTLNGSFLYFIKIRYHFLGKTVFTLKEHPC